MASDAIANFVDRLRSSGFDPRKLAQGVWESRCPGHGGVDHAFSIVKGQDGKLILQCRATENCSFSAILKKLNIKLRHLDRETHPSVLRRLQAAEIQPSLYESEKSPASEPAIVSLPAANLEEEASICPDENRFEGDVPAIVAHIQLKSKRAGANRSIPRPRQSHEPQKSRATERLLRITTGARPFRRPDGRYSVSIVVDGHQECHHLESPDVARWLTRLYFGKRPQGCPRRRHSRLRSVRMRLEPISRVLPTSADLVRVGCNESSSSIFLDLGDSTWRAVDIRATGWQVVDRPGVHFRRSAGQRALIVPARDGSIGLLKKYINVEPADLPLLIAWLTAALKPTGPHPILVITGEQGSAKSTLARICRLLIDPHQRGLQRRAQRPSRLDGGGASRLGSGVRQLEAQCPDWLANGLCRLVTGGGISTRGLFTNHDEVVWSAPIGRSS